MTDSALGLHYNDLDPQITYRHVLAANVSARHPLRVVALIDSDAFYAACETVRLKLDRDTPLAVIQWASFIAVNYPARKYGISRFSKEVPTIEDALRRCPNLKVVHVATYKEGEKEPRYRENPDPKTHKVSLDYYRQESKKVHQMIADGVPDGISERASIDEAFIDFTRPVLDIMLQRYPYLSRAPEDPRGLDTPLPSPPSISWDGLGSLIPAAFGKSQDLKSDEPKAPCALFNADDSVTWHDVALSIAAELMNRIRADIERGLGYTTSAGIARNKFLAKLCASYKKPNSQAILRNTAIPNYLQSVPFQKIRFLGGKLGKTIAKEFSALTVGDLLGVSLNEMQCKFGDNGIWIYELLRGIDRAEVKTKPEQMKSMLASKNLPTPVSDIDGGLHWIRVLSAELALRLNNAQKVTPSLWPKSLVLYARKGYESGISKQAPFPFKPEITVETVTAAGHKLWKSLVKEMKQPMKITSLQLAFTGIRVSPQGQQNIDAFLTGGIKRPRDDQSNDQSGSMIVVYHCDQCGKQINILTSGVAEEQKILSERAKVEHADFHFALSLAKQADQDLPAVALPISSSTLNQLPSKKQKIDNGIMKFLQQRK